MIPTTTLKGSPDDALTLAQANVKRIRKRLASYAARVSTYEKKIARLLRVKETDPHSVAALFDAHPINIANYEMTLAHYAETVPPTEADLAEAEAKVAALRDGALALLLQSPQLPERT